MPVTSYLRSKICLPLPSRQPQLKTLTLLQQLTMKAVFHEFDNRSPAASRRFLSFSPSLSLSLSQEKFARVPRFRVFSHRMEKVSQRKRGSGGGGGGLKKRKRKKGMEEGRKKKSPWRSHGRVFLSRGVEQRHWKQRKRRRRRRGREGGWTFHDHKRENVVIKQAELIQRGPNSFAPWPSTYYSLSCEWTENGENGRVGERWK